MNLISTTFGLLSMFLFVSSAGAEIHDLFELKQNCSTMWKENLTSSYKQWHDECEVSVGIKILPESTMKEIVPVYKCILTDLGMYFLSTGMPIMDAIHINLADDIGGKEDWRFHIIEDVFSICITKDKVSEIMDMSTEEFIEHNQCYWRVIDERCHPDTHQKI